MHSTRRAVVLDASLIVVVATLLLVSGFPSRRADAGFEFPCTLGTASPTGFQPCTPCAPGTIAPIFNATSCQPCPVGTASTVSGGAECAPCACDDEIPCTTCEPDTAVCTAEPVAACEEVHVEFTGVVDAVFDALSPVDAGMPIAGSYDVDPLAPDNRPDNPDLGRYSSALRSLEMRVGDPAVFVATSPLGRADVWLEPDENYSALFDLTVTTPTGGAGDVLSLSLTGADPFDDDALIVAPDVAAFDTAEIRVTRFDLQVLVVLLFQSSTLTITAPEPGGAALACGAAAALIAVARISSRRTT